MKCEGEDETVCELKVSFIIKEFKCPVCIVNNKGTKKGELEN